MCTYISFLLVLVCVLSFMTSPPEITGGLWFLYRGLFRFFFLNIWLHSRCKKWEMGCLNLRFNTPVWWYLSLKLTVFLLGHRSQRLQWPIVITRCPASVVRRLSSVVRRLWSVCRPLDYLHFRLLLQNRLMDFDETWYWWSTQGPLQVLLFFGQIRPGADPGRGKNRSRGVPFFRKLLLQTGRLQQQTECIAVI